MYELMPFQQCTATAGEEAPEVEESSRRREATAHAEGYEAQAAALIDLVKAELLAGRGTTGFVLWTGGDTTRTGSRITLRPWWPSRLLRPGGFVASSPVLLTPFSRR
ncbi:MAG: hypothetical protein ACPGU1_11360 [Myxococcota bacterium]